MCAVCIRTATRWGGLLDELITFTAGTATKVTLMADSSSYMYDKYEWMETSKGGRWKRRTVKHHVLLTLNGCVAASAVTNGDRNDCSMLSRLTGTVPMGSGYLLVNRKHCCKDNCREALCIGRLPCMMLPELHQAAFTKSTTYAT